MSHTPAVNSAASPAPTLPSKDGSGVLASGALFASSAAAELGKRGGIARALALPPERRQEIARKAARARWSPLDLAMFRDIAAQLDAEALTWKQGFAIWTGKRRGYVWPQDSDTPWVQPRVEKLQQSANYLRSLANDRDVPTSGTNGET